MTWPEFVHAWAGRVDGDRRLRALGRGTDVAFTVRRGEEVAWLHVVEGELVAHALDDGFGRRVDVGVAAPADVLDAFWRADPPPERHSLFALLARAPGFHIEGGHEAFAQHAHVIARVLELGRPAAPPDRDEDRRPPDLSAVEGRYVSVALSTGQAQVFAEQAGRGRDLLMLHTAGSDARQWHHLLADDDLRDGWRMTAFDLPGHGRSTLPTGLREGEWRLDTDRYVEAIVAVADALGLADPVVIGCSMGGQICLELAWRHPDLFAGVVACQASDHIEGRKVTWAKHARVDETLFVPEWTASLMGPRAPQARRDEVRWAYAQGGHGIFWGDIEFYSGDWDGRDRVGDIDTARCPVHVLCGEYDPSCTPAIARATAERIPGATFTQMDGLGHFPMAEDPAAFMGYLRPILASIGDRVAT